jgi:Flp pilus assembly protein TadB
MPEFGSTLDAVHMSNDSMKVGGPASQRFDGTQEREDPKQRLNRELIELLNELRVALPGVQVLFAFLLTMPLSSRFADLTSGQEVLYFGTLLSTAIGTAFLMTPTAYHRLRFREADKEHLLRVGNRAAVTGLAFTIASVGAAVFLIADLLYHSALASLFAALVTAVYLWLWFGLALLQRAKDV